MQSWTILFRPVPHLLAASIGLSACEQGTAQSSDEAVVRGEASRFNQTVAVPAVLGALTGAALGGILCRSKDKTACAAGGAAAGGLIGGGAGYLVDMKNRQFANREEELGARTEAAGEEIAHVDKVITATNGLIAQYRREVSALRAKYRQASEGTSPDQKQIAALHEDIRALRVIIQGTQDTIVAINTDISRLSGSDTGKLIAQRDALRRQQATVKHQLEVLTGIGDSLHVS